MKKHEDGFHGAEIPGCIDRKVFHDYQSKEEALEALGSTENSCPTCGKQMSIGRWINQQSRRYAAMAVCPEHGSFLLRVRLSPEEEELKVIRMIYEGGSDAAKSFEAGKVKTKVRKRRSRRKSEA